jgi:hypothetical protein
MVEGVSKFFTWDMEDVIMFHKKNCVKGRFSFILAFQMPVTTKDNLPILTSYHIFPNREGLERLEKCVPKRNHSMRKLIIFKTPEKKTFKL